MSSPQFAEWWAARRHIHPIPSDPYRAFMIDKSLKAKPLPKEMWVPRTNRSDILADFPSGLPAFKVRPMSRKQMARWHYVPKAARREPSHPFVQVLHRHKEVFLEKYHLPDVLVKAEQGMGSVGAGHYQGSAYFLGTPYVTVGIRNIKRKKPEEYGKGGAWDPLEAQALASFTHELGHHAESHGRLGVAETYFEELLQKQGTSTGKKIAWNPTQRKEFQAWKLADPMLQQVRPVQKFRKKVMLGTYLDTTPIFNYSDRDLFPNLEWVKYNPNRRKK